MSENSSTDAEDSFLKELQGEFLNEVSLLLEDIEESFLRLDDPEAREEELKKIFRVAHSIKGSGQAVGFQDLSSFAHLLEDLLAILRVHPDCATPEINSIMLESTDALKARVSDLKTDRSLVWSVDHLSAALKKNIARLEKQESTDNLSSNEELIRVNQPATQKEHGADVKDGEHHKSRGENQLLKVDVSRIDSVMNLVGELLVIRSQMIHHPLISGTSDHQLTSIVSQLDKTVRSLQDRTLGIRMMALKGLFLKAQRIVRDLSIKLNKPTEFVMIGEETELDRNMIELLQDPLIHLVRNSMDHGIENADARAAAQKNSIANIRLAARQANGRVIIEISDDGGGIPRARVLAKARKNGLVPQDRSDESYSDQDVFQFLFMPGFSTAEQVSDLSGRGVGLDVVRSNIEKVRGYIEIESKLGVGTCFRLSLPLTTAITDGMMISTEGQIFILPMENIREIVRLDQKKITVLNDGTKVFDVRGRFYPVISVREALSTMKSNAQALESAADLAKKVLLIVECRSELFALLCDSVLGQTQVVLKSLGDHFDLRTGVSGGAVMGDGSVSLVLDIEGIVKEYFLASGGGSNEKSITA